MQRMPVWNPSVAPVQFWSWPARLNGCIHSTAHPGGISVNVGVFQGGTLSNVISAAACAEVDVRFSNSDEAARIENEIFNLRAYDERVQLIVGAVLIARR